MNLNDLIQNIVQWAHDRNIIKGSEPIDQAMKLFSEFGELADNVGKGRDCRDDIGDVFVVLTIIGEQIRKESMIQSAKINYKPLIDWSEEQQPKSLNNLKELVVMLNRDLHCLMGEIDTYDARDDIYWCVACLRRICELKGYTLEECVQIAYNDIKDRKGLMHNGVFIKESDPAYASVIKSIEENYRA